MFCANIVSAEESVERCSLGGSLDRRTPLGLLPFYQAHHADNAHARLARSFNRCHCGSAGGADVVDDNHRRVRLLKSLDASPCAVRLFYFSHQESIQDGGAWSFQGMPGARCGHIADDRVSAQGKTAYRPRPQLMLPNKIEHRQTGQAPTLSRKCGGAAVNVVIAGSPGRELKLAQPEGDAGQHLEQRFAMSKGHGLSVQNLLGPIRPSNNGA